VGWTSIVVIVLCDYIQIFFFVFFFQAEDGIRDRTVTGVQTCALPISRELGPLQWTDGVRGQGGNRHLARGARTCAPSCELPPTRSEERRVGKECRSRWWR